MKSEPLIEPGDLRISAYLFGELSAEEALVVEALLIRSPEALAELEEMRATSELLRVSLARELADGLSSVAEDGAPSLAVVAESRGVSAEDKVVDFEPSDRKGFSGLQVAAIAAMAAALAAVAAAVPGMIPDGAEQSPLVAEANGKKGEASGETHGGSALKVGDDRKAGVAAAHPGDRNGIQLVSDFTRSPGEKANGFRARTLGSDSTRPVARFLSEDPIDLHVAPLPAELLSYFPDLDDFSESEITTEMDDPNVVNIYLDTEQFPDPDIVHRRVSLSGGIFEEEGERTRSFYRADARSDAEGHTSVILKGMVRLEDGEEVAVPEAGYEFGGGPPVSLAGEQTLSLPSGAMLRRAMPPVSVDAAEVSLISRYLERQLKRVARADALAKSGRRHLGQSEPGDAVTDLEAALQLLPDAPATENRRKNFCGWLEKANGRLADLPPNRR